MTKPVKDHRHRTASLYRYHCCHCQRTFRHYPEGVDRADQTQRLRKLAALMWVLGLSLRNTCALLSVFGVSLSHMSVWRDIQEHANLQRKRRQMAIRYLADLGLPDPEGQVSAVAEQVADRRAREFLIKRRLGAETEER